MDPSLLKERAKFIERAKAQPVVEKRKKAKDENSERSSKKHKSSSSSFKSKHSSSSSKNFDYKKIQGSSQYNFGILAKIVNHMKKRHQHGDTYPLTIDEILDETSQLDVGSKQRHWLITEALVNNPKIKVVDNGEKYAFKPKYDIRDKKGLLNLLKKHDLHGWGGILLDDIEESLPDMDKALKALGANVIFVQRQSDKKKVLFYNDKYCRYTVDEEFQKLWRGVPIEGMDEKKIEEYLEKQGISSMQDMGSKKVVPVQKRKGGGKGKRSFKKHNEHLNGILEDYSDMANKKTQS